MAHHHRIQVDELYAALREDSEAKRIVAAELLGSLVREIILNGELQIDAHRHLARRLAVS